MFLILIQNKLETFELKSVETTEDNFLENDVLLDIERPNSVEMLSEDYWFKNYAYEIIHIGTLYLKPEIEDGKQTYSYEIALREIENRLYFGLIPTENMDGFVGSYTYYEMPQSYYEYWSKAILGEHSPDFTSVEYTEFLNQNFYNSYISNKNVIEVRKRRSPLYSSFSDQRIYTLEVLDASNQDAIKVILNPTIKTKNIEHNYKATLIWNDKSGYVVRDISHTHIKNSDVVLHGEYAEIEDASEIPKYKYDDSPPAVNFEIKDNNIVVNDSNKDKPVIYEMPHSIKYTNEQGEANDRIILVSPDYKNIIFMRDSDTYSCNLLPDAQPILIKKNPPPREDYPDFSIHLYPSHFIDNNNIMFNAGSWESIAYTEVVDVYGNEVAFYDFMQSYGTYIKYVANGEIIAHAIMKEDEDFSKINLYTIDYSTLKLEICGWIPFINEDNSYFHIYVVNPDSWEVIISKNYIEYDSAGETIKNETRFYFAHLKEKTIKELPFFIENASTLVKSIENGEVYILYINEHGGEFFVKTKY